MTPEQQRRRRQAQSRLDKADGCWKEYPDGATVTHIESGEDLTVVRVVELRGTGFSKYLVRDQGGRERFTLRCLIERKRTKDKRRRAL